MQEASKLLGFIALAAALWINPLQARKSACNNKDLLSPAQKAVCQTLADKQARLQAKKNKIERELIALEGKQLSKSKL